MRAGGDGGARTLLLVTSEIKALPKQLVGRKTEAHAPGPDAGRLKSECLLAQKPSPLTPDLCGELALARSARRDPTDAFPLSLGRAASHARAEPHLPTPDRRWTPSLRARAPPVPLPDLQAI